MLYFISLLRTVFYLVLFYCLYIIVNICCFLYLYQNNNAYINLRNSFSPSYINDDIDIKSLHIKDFLTITAFPSFKINNYSVIHNAILCPDKWFVCNNIPSVTSKISVRACTKKLIKHMKQLIHSLEMLPKNMYPIKIILYDHVTVFLVYKDFVMRLYPWQIITKEIIDTIMVINNKDKKIVPINKKLYYMFDITLYKKDKIMYVPIKKEVYHELF